MRSSGVTPVKLEQTDAVILIVDLSRLRCEMGAVFLRTTD